MGCLFHVVLLESRGLRTVLCGAFFVRGCGRVLSLSFCLVSIFYIKQPIKNERWIFAVHTMTFIRDQGEKVSASSSFGLF